MCNAPTPNYVVYNAVLKQKKQNKKTFFMLFITTNNIKIQQQYPYNVYNPNIFNNVIYIHKHPISTFF